MNTKSQQELIEDTNAKQIVFVGSFGAGKSIAVALKSLETDYSLILNSSHKSLTAETIPAFKTITDDFDFRRTTMEINTNKSKIFLRNYNDMNVIIGLKRFTYTLLLDNFSSLSEEAQIEIYRRCIVRSPKQIILFVNPIHIRNGSFLSKILKERTINASIYDNIHVPEDYIKRLRKEAPFVTKDNIKGFF